MILCQSFLEMVNFIFWKLSQIPDFKGFFLPKLNDLIS